MRGRMKAHRGLKPILREYAPQQGMHCTSLLLNYLQQGTHQMRYLVSQEHHHFDV